MARKGSPTILQDELYPPSAETSRPEFARELSPRSDFSGNDIDDARLVDLDVAEESPFLRGQKRVSARRSSLPKKTANRLLWASAAAAVLAAAAIVAAALYQYGEHSWRFRIESSDNIEVAGMQNVTKAQIMEVMGADIGRNIFFVPLAQQQAQLEQIPWVESASVMRFVPNRLKVEIQERTPVAFARVGPRIFLIDAGGTLMELPHNHKYSFPVILGMNPGEPLSTRAPRMKAYNDLVQDLDSSGAHYSQDLSEVDLSDLENLKIRVNDPAGDVLVELGSSDYLNRYKTYASHVQEWRRQFQKLDSVNLRYDNQVIVNPEIEGVAKPTPLTGAAAKDAVSAGVKPAALITRAGPHDKPLPKPAFELTDKKLNPKSAAAKKPAAKGKKAAQKQPKTSAQKKSVAKSGTPTPKVVATAQPSSQNPSAPKPSQSAPASTSKAATPKPSAAIASPSTSPN
jgi:cell division protein FtsQ